MNRVKRVNRSFLWLTVVCLSTISLIPLVSDILGKYPQLIISACLFNGLLVITSALNYFAWLVSVISNRKEINIKKITYIIAFLRATIPLLVYVISFGVAFASTYASIGISMIVPLIDVLAAFHLDPYLLAAKVTMKIYESTCGKTEKKPEEIKNV